MLIHVDVRCLQDVNFAQRGIGQHTLYVLGLLRRLKDVKLVPLIDPVLGPLLEDVDHLFDLPARWLDRLDRGMYFNPSPLTHDTAPLVVARRRGMRTCAIVHDFIPMRFRGHSPESLAAYRYLVNSLTRYDALFPNSLFTSREIKKHVPDYTGLVIPLHCRSRFDPSLDAPQSGQVRAATLKQLASQTPYAFVATSDDPRKNPDIGVRAALELRSANLSLVVGGGLTETTRKRLLAAYPDQCLLGEPTFLPRLSDAELRQVYEGARLVIVGSLDEGFSLPVAEALSLGCRVVASDIPAHAEQIEDDKCLFTPQDVRSLMGAVRHALTGDCERSYVKFNYDKEFAALRAFFRRSRPERTAVPSQPLVMIGPGLECPTGIAVFNRLLVTQLRSQGASFEYIDLDVMNPEAFYAWLYARQDAPMLYVMGNNNVFHSHCYVALQNIPGFCIMHDSRLFEFLLNRHGPYYIQQLSQQRLRSRSVTLENVVEWQQDRRLLPDSFLDPLVTRVTGLVVHSRISADHVRKTYQVKAHYLPFALQMTDEEVRFVVEMRETNKIPTPAGLTLVMLGETEPSKGCSELVFALKILTLQGVRARLHFVGKSDEPYHSELTQAAETLGLTAEVVFTRYVSRQRYLDSLIAADIVVQLRYPMFGQVSGPLADAVACGVPAVTTEDLAIGMGFSAQCDIIPNRFSPLHIAEGVRRLIERPRPKSVPRTNSMADYAHRLLEIQADAAGRAPAISRTADA